MCRVSGAILKNICSLLIIYFTMSSLAMAVANIQRSGSPTSLSTPNTRCNNSAYGRRSFTSSRQGSSVHSRHGNFGYNRSTTGSRRGNKGWSRPFRHQPSSNNSLSGSRAGSRAPSRPQSLAVCKFFLNGNCTRGSSCAFRRHHSGSSCAFRRHH